MKKVGNGVLGRGYIEHEQKQSSEKWTSGCNRVRGALERSA